MMYKFYKGVFEMFKLVKVKDRVVDFISRFEKDKTPEEETESDKIKKDMETRACEVCGKNWKECTCYEELLKEMEERDEKGVQENGGGDIENPVAGKEKVRIPN